MPVTLRDLTRKTGFLEESFYNYEKNNVFRCVSISAKLSCPLNAGLAWGALRLLVLKYPLLILCIDDASNVQFEPLQKIFLKDVFLINSLVDTCFKDKEADTGCLTNYSFANRHKQKKPMWKVMYYEKTGWLTFNSSHTFTDGGSVIAYLKDFVESLNHVDDSKIGDILFNLADDLPLLKTGIPRGTSPDIDIHQFKVTAKKRKISEKQILEQSFVDGMPETFESSQIYKGDYIIDEKSPLNFTKPIFLNLKNDTVKDILHACRVNNVKLQSYIILVYVHTINQLCPGIYTNKYLKTIVAASMRNRSTTYQSHGSYLGKTSRFDDGFYSYGASFFLDPGTSFSWEAVRKYHQFLHRKLSAENSIQQNPGVKTIKFEELVNIPRFSRKDELFFLCTNLGHIDMNQYENNTKFQIEDFLFAASAGAVLGTHHMTVVSTGKGGLNIGFTNGDPNIKDWVNFKKAFAENLVSFLSEKRDRKSVV